MQMNKEIIVENLNLEDFILLQELLQEVRLPIGDLQRYVSLISLMEKVNGVVQAFEN